MIGTDIFNKNGIPFLNTKYTMKVGLMNIAFGTWLVQPVYLPIQVPIGILTDTTAVDIIASNVHSSRKLN